MMGSGNRFILNKLFLLEAISLIFEKIIDFLLKSLISCKLHWMPTQVNDFGQLKKENLFSIRYTNVRWKDLGGM